LPVCCSVEFPFSDPGWSGTDASDPALESAFRAAVAFLPPRPVTNPAWYHKRAAFYVFLATIEALVVLLYAVARADQRMFEDGEAERKANAVTSTSGSEKPKPSAEDV